MRGLIPDSYSFVQAVIPLSSLYQETVSLATDLHTSGRPIVAMQPNATQRTDVSISWMNKVETAERDMWLARIPRKRIHSRLCASAGELSGITCQMIATLCINCRFFFAWHDPDTVHVDQACFGEGSKR